MLSFRIGDGLAIVVTGRLEFASLSTVIIMNLVMPDGVNQRRGFRHFSKYDIKTGVLRSYIQACRAHFQQFENQICQHGRRYISSILRRASMYCANFSHLTGTNQQQKRKQQAVE